MARPNPPLRHMVFVIVALMVPVLAITAWFTRIPPTTVTPVDWKPVVQAAREDHPYPIATPETLPDGWVASRASWLAEGRPDDKGKPAVGNTLRLGFFTPQQVYVALDQRDTQQADFLTTALGDTRVTGSSQVGGATWERRAATSGPLKALVKRDDQAVTVVSSDLDYPALESFAASLRFAP